MDQRVLGALAERAAHLADKGDAAALSTLVKKAAAQTGYAPWTVVSLISAEWDRLGIRRVPRDVILHA